MRSLRLLGAVTAACVIAAGCGDDDASSGAAPVTTATVSGEPGGPDEGEPDYTGLGTWWRKLPRDERLASAAEFAEDHPDECGGVSAEDLERQTGIAFGYDFPEATPTDQVMLETCALIRDGA
jgi:hypothetical protein